MDNTETIDFCSFKRYLLVRDQRQIWKFTSAELFVLLFSFTFSYMNLISQQAQSSSDNISAANCGVFESSKEHY